MFKCCVSGAKEDVEESEERSETERSETVEPAIGRCGNDGARSGTAITSGRDDIGPPALVKGKSLDGGQNVSSGA